MFTADEDDGANDDDCDDDDDAVLETEDAVDDTNTGGIFLTIAETMAGVEFAANGNDFGLKFTIAVCCCCCCCCVICLPECWCCFCN